MGALALQLIPVALALGSALALGELGALAFGVYALARGQGRERGRLERLLRARHPRHSGPEDDCGRSSSLGLRGSASLVLLFWMIVARSSVAFGPTVPGRLCPERRTVSGETLPGRKAACRNPRKETLRAGSSWA
jgi:hypothetical protein